MKAGDKALLAVMALVALVGVMVFALEPLFPIGGAPTESLKFETIEEGLNSWHYDRSQYVITDDAAWKSLWLKVHPPSSHVPYVNFSSEIVVAAFQGNY
jgi:hypothetical protein